MVRVWCSAPDRDRGIGRCDLYRLWIARWLGRATDDVLQRLCDHAERLARRRLGRVCGDDIPDRWWLRPTRFTSSNWRRKQTWPFDVTGRRLLAELVAGWPIDRARARCCSEPSSIQVISSFGDSPQPLAGRAGTLALLSGLVARQPPARDRRQPGASRGEDWDLAIRRSLARHAVAAPHHRRRQRSPAGLEASH